MLKSLSLNLERINWLRKGTLKTVKATLTKCLGLEYPSSPDGYLAGWLITKKNYRAENKKKHGGRA